ncbi:MAG: helix-turn-helix transcriptional regulator [Rickettsiales bacterium]|nr:helix-turn-helix transcriptional regulator [Rickettsiales bacterium]
MSQTKKANSIDQSIGKKLAELRLKAKMSRQELGSKIGVTHQQCQKYELGINRIAASRLALVAKVFKKPVGYFFSDTKH